MSRDTEVHHLVFMKSRELDSVILSVPIHTKPLKPTNPIILLNITYTVLAFLFVWCHKSPFPLDLHTSTAPALCHTAPGRKPLNPGTEGCRRCCCHWCIGSPRSSAFAAGKRTSLWYQRGALLEEGSCWTLSPLLRQHLSFLRITSSNLPSRWHEGIDGLEVMKMGIEKPTTDGVEVLWLKSHYTKSIFHSKFVLLGQTSRCIRLKPCRNSRPSNRRPGNYHKLESIKTCT